MRHRCSGYIPTKTLRPRRAELVLALLLALTTCSTGDEQGHGELEDRLAADLSERGVFAAFLLLLSRRKLGEVFLLSDLETETLEEGFSPEVVRQKVELLSKPPFLFLKRLTPGEFLLRQGGERCPGQPPGLRREPEG